MQAVSPSGTDPALKTLRDSADEWEDEKPQANDCRLRLAGLATPLPQAEKKMTNGRTNILLIEDNAGDADLLRLRLLEGGAQVDVNCVDRLSAALASVAQEPTGGGGTGFDSSGQPWS